MYDHVISFVRSQVWALEPGKLAVMLDLLHFRAAGGRLTDEEIRARLLTAGVDPDAPRPLEMRAWDLEADGWRAADAAPAQGRQIVAVIPINGMITHRAGSMSEWSGGTSTERVTAKLRASVADPLVRGIVLDVNSPGGAVEGVPELAAEIRGARDVKPLEAVANAHAQSGAFWLGSQAGRFTAIPSGYVGSLGVFTTHEDQTAQQAAEGVKTTIIRDTVLSKYKAEGNPFEPLTEEARAYAESIANDYANMFAADVAKGRGVSRDTVRRDYGQGRSLTAQAALKAGMIDGIGSIEDAVRRVGSQRATLGRPETAVKLAALRAFVDAADAEMRAAEARREML